jgi:MarR family transcriptional regulator, organic hydroperoxide resistance regulator
MDHPNIATSSKCAATVAGRACAPTIDDMSDDCASNPLGLLMGLAEQLGHLLDEAAGAEHLTRHQASVLMQLDEPVRMGDMAQRRVCDPSTLTTMVQRLERDGFVQRTRDPADARARVIELTPKGRRAREAFLARVGDGAAVLDTLPPEHRRALHELFADRT